MSSTRRTFLSFAAAAAVARAAHHEEAPLIDTHIHLFSKDRKRFPVHRNGPYDPPPQTVETYGPFVKEAGIAHSVIVHPEPYQDDHSYLEHCFANEPSKGYFKGTLLLDALREDSPARVAAMVKKHPGRIVALRVHAMGERGAPPKTSGTIVNRDLSSDAMARFWRAAADNDLAVQMHFKPYFAPQIDALKAKFPSVPVVLDHLGRNGMGNPVDFEAVLALAKRPNTYMKFSGWPYSSNVDFPHMDLKPVVRRVFDRFGPSRMIWGGLGYNIADFKARLAMLNEMFDYATEDDRRQIRGLTAKRLFGF